MAILVTGGAGYIGSHTVVELQNAGYDVVVLDNLSNASEKSLERVEKITGKPVKFYKADILDREALEEIFTKESIDSCIHFAGLKAVGESVQKPWEYYNNNITGTLTLVDVMRKHNVKNIIFSSSATVYGDPAIIPITEECPKGQCTNPYGWTKSMLEQVLMDMQKADPEWNVILLRYFNPIGAHKSGTMGENPNGIPNNLMPYITQVAVGKLKELGVFGNDYDTPDGTGVRDYIHVVDLAIGHVKALKKIEEKAGLCVYNLGTGVGYSVLDIVKNFEEATGVKIPYVIKERRPGDIATCYADAKKAEKEYQAETTVFHSKALTMTVKNSQISEFFQKCDDETFLTRVCNIGSPSTYEVNTAVLGNLSKIASVFAADKSRDLIKFYSKEVDGVLGLYAYDETNCSFDYLLGYYTNGEVGATSTTIFKENFLNATKGLTAETLEITLDTAGASRILVDAGEAKVVIAAAKTN